MPDPSDSLKQNTNTDMSSWIDDEDEGTAQKPNVFSKYEPVMSAEK